MKGHHKTSQRGVESLAVDATPVVHPYSGCKRKIMDAEFGGNQRIISENPRGKPLGILQRTSLKYSV
jgi:hypothetical protein